MCLVHLVFRVHSDMEILLAGNRDEFFRRPSAPPAVIARAPAVHAGKDLEAGGTWMGRNAHGLLAAITNRYHTDRRGTQRQVPQDVLSRGEIVLGLLGHAGAESAAEWAARLPVARYRPFNLLFGDAARFYYFSSEEGGAPRPLDAGFHALSNSTLDDRTWPKVARSHAFFEANRALSGEKYLDRLQLFFRDATPPDQLPAGHRNEEIHGAMGAVMITTPEYGTVSSTIITSGGALGERYYFADGPSLRGGGDSGDLGPYRLISFGDIAENEQE